MPTKAPTTAPYIPFLLDPANFAPRTGDRYSARIMNNREMPNKPRCHMGTVSGSLPKNRRTIPAKLKTGPGIAGRMLPMIPRIISMAPILRIVCILPSLTLYGG